MILFGIDDFMDMPVDVYRGLVSEDMPYPPGWAEWWSAHKKRILAGLEQVNHESAGSLVCKVVRVAREITPAGVDPALDLVLRSIGEEFVPQTPVSPPDPERLLELTCPARPPLPMGWVEWAAALPPGSPEPPLPTVLADWWARQREAARRGIEHLIGTAIIRVEYKALLRLKALNLLDNPDAQGPALRRVVEILAEATAPYLDKFGLSSDSR